jgi:hypothetical protein
MWPGSDLETTKVATVKQPRKKGRVLKMHTVAAESISIESQAFLDFLSSV